MVLFIWTCLYSNIIYAEDLSSAIFEPEYLSIGLGVESSVDKALACSVESTRFRYIPFHAELFHLDVVQNPYAGVRSVVCDLQIYFKKI